MAFLPSRPPPPNRPTHPRTHPACVVRADRPLQGINVRNKVPGPVYPLTPSNTTTKAYHPRAVSPEGHVYAAEGRRHRRDGAACHRPARRRNLAYTRALMLHGKCSRVASAGGRLELREGEGKEGGRAHRRQLTGGVAVGRRSLGRASFRSLAARRGRVHVWGVQGTEGVERDVARRSSAPRPPSVRVGVRAAFGGRWPWSGLGSGPGS